MAEPSYKVIGAVEDADYAKKLEAEAKKKERGIYPRTILIGLGGSGAKALMHLRRLVLERFGAVDALDGVAYLSIDTDVRSKEPSADEEKTNPLAKALSFGKDERVDLKIDFKNYVGPNIIHHPQIQDWWDESALPSRDFNIEAGAGQIRPLSRLAFFTNRSAIQDGVSRAYRKVTSMRVDSSRVDTGSKVRVVVVAGLAGGTGSGIFLDLAALIQDHLGHHEKPSLEGFFMLPGGFSTVEQDQNYPKIAANGFAALKELNHYLTHPFEVQWDAASAPVQIRGLYDRYVLFSGTNASDEHLDNLEDCYRAIGEVLFLDFGAGPMSGWVQGVRVNREQYLRSAVTYTYRLPKMDGSVAETHADQWRNAFSSVGISKLVFPSWRLINRAKYELASEMVALMDPGRVAAMGDVITNHRNRFMFESGIFQGERDTEEGHQSYWQIRDRLAKQSGVGVEISNIYDHIRKFQTEIQSLAENMFTEKNTVELSDEVWKRIAGLWGDPASPGSEGDWPRQIRENRKTFISEVDNRLPGVVEDFRRKPAVGISGVLAILQDILSLFDRPADQARYTDWFKQQKARLQEQAKAAQALWKKRILIADEASRGWAANAETHQKAVLHASEAFYEYWRAVVNEVICDEGIKVLVGARDTLKAQLSRLEHIAERMLKLESEYQNLAGFYENPQRSFIVHEIDAPPLQGDLLDPYLGKQADVRQEKLQRLLDKGLRQMQLDTLEAIGEALSGEFERFRENLSAQAFYALRGENGTTAAFVDNPDEAQTGFIERYSIFQILKGKTEEQRREYFDLLYRKGLPWAQKNKSENLLNLHVPHGDAFLGYVTQDFGGIADELKDHLQKNAESQFSPRPVRIFDPSEIIFYTELTAFPVYYLSEISDLKRHYESLVNDMTRVTALHIHQDHHQFQPVMPFNPGQLPKYQVAWRLFVQSQILGLICSLRQRVGDDVRVAYQWRRKVGPFEVQWMDLGPEGKVIQRLMTDVGMLNQIRPQIEAAQDRLTSFKAGGWAHLAALADYYYYCIFPVRGEIGSGGSAMTSLGSMQNLVCADLRREWRSKAGEGLGDGDRLEWKIRELLTDFANWTQPVYRDRGQILPSSPALLDGERLEEWELLSDVDRSIRGFQSQGLIPPSRDNQGNLVMRYPRMAIRWESFEKAESAVPVPEPPAAPQPALSEATYHYALGKQRVGQFSAGEIARRVSESPGAQHRVWTQGFGEAWRDAMDVPEIVALLAMEPPPLEESSLQAEPPPLV